MDDIKSKLLEPLSNQGYVLEQIDAASLDELTNSLRRYVVCLRSAWDGNAAWPTGPSFCIDVSEKLAFVGTFVGDRYLCNPAKVCDVAISLAKALKDSTGPNPVPQHIVKHFGLDTTEALYFAQSNADSWDEALEDRGVVSIDCGQIHRALSNENVKLVVELSDGIATLKLGACKTLHEMQNKIFRGSVFSLFMSPGLSRTRDCAEMLRLLVNAVNYPAYDGSWGNRIDLADPFYSATTLVRPQCPAVFESD